MINTSLLTMRDPDRRPIDGSFVRTMALLTITPGSLASAQSVAGAVNVPLDNSGSMNGEKLILAQNAAKLTLREIQGMEIGVMTFSYDCHDLGTAPAHDNVEREEICRKIDALQAHGGTRLDKPLQVLLNRYRKTEKCPRVLILSDGQTEEPEKTLALASQLSQAGIRVDFIATDDVDINLARALTDATNGRLEYMSKLTSTGLTMFLLDQATEAGSIVATNIQVCLRLPRGGRIVSVQKIYPDVIPLNLASSWHSLGDLPRDDRLELFLELEFPAPAQDGPYVALEADIEFNVPQRQLWNQSITVPLRVNLFANATSVAVPSVVKAFHQVQIERDLTAAAQATDPTQALEHLGRAARRTNLVGDSRKTRLVETMAADIRKTNVVAETTRKTAIAAGRRTKIVGS